MAEKSETIEVRLSHGAKAAFMERCRADRLALPALAHEVRTSPGAFERLDRNHDGVLSYEEFRRR